MKQIQFSLLCIWILITISCAKDDEATVNNDCGNESNALCYAHNWDEFAMLNDLVQGDAVYSHLYINSNGISAFSYKVELKNVCLNADLSMDLTNIIKVGTPFTCLAEFYINGDQTSIIMDNVNGIITGHLNKKLQGFPISTITIYNLISIPNNLKDPTEILKYDMDWYNTNVSSHGITAKFQNPK